MPVSKNERSPFAAPPIPSLAHCQDDPHQIWLWMERRLAVASWALGHFVSGGGRISGALEPVSLGVGDLIDDVQDVARILPELSPGRFPVGGAK